MLATDAWKSRPMAGSAMPTTVASRAAIPEPSTVAASTQRPLPLEYRRRSISAGPGSARVSRPDLTTPRARNLMLM
jgi:hypothetical protein